MEEKEKGGKIGNLSDRVKQAIRQEYKFRCQYCDDKERKATHIEHIIPKDKGGTNDLDNLTLSCERCNLKKTNLNLPEAYAGILLARSKQKRKKIETRINKSRFKKSPENTWGPSEYFVENMIDKEVVKNGDRFLKISTNEDHIRNLTVLYKQQNRITTKNDENYIEHQTYKWNSLFGEQFHHIFKRMMYISIDVVEYIAENKTFKKIGSETLIEGIFYGVNEYVKLFISDRLLNIIQNNSIFSFKDILNGKELSYKEIKTKNIENPFK